MNRLIEWLPTPEVRANTNSHVERLSLKIYRSQQWIKEQDPNLDELELIRDQLESIRALQMLCVHREAWLVREREEEARKKKVKPAILKI